MAVLSVPQDYRYLWFVFSTADPADSEVDLTKIKVSLLERNRNPHISSHLPLTPSSVFFSGIVGDIEKNNRTKSQERTEVREGWGGIDIRFLLQVIVMIVWGGGGGR